MQEITFEMPAYMGFVPGLRTAMSRIAGTIGFNDKEMYEIETVTDEICSNAIEHGSQGKDKHITVECKFDTKYMEIIIKDSGSPQFNVEKAFKEGQRLMEEETAKPILDTIRRQRGLMKPILDTIRRQRGLMIVKSYVDALDITSHPHGTIVRMVKKSNNKTSQK
jgi:anti-sigma regulatory factor (Ser/Thr protein kinase)